jgi:hypothetical protein
MFNRIYIWRLCWPWKNLNSMVIKLVGSFITLVFRIIILLKYYISSSFTIIFYGSLKFILQNRNVKVSIYLLEFSPPSTITRTPLIYFPQFLSISYTCYHQEILSYLISHITVTSHITHPHITSYLIMTSYMTSL